MSFSGRLAALNSMEAWMQDDPEGLRSDLVRAAEEAERGPSDETAARLEEHITSGADRDLFVLMTHAYAAGYLRGYEMAVDA